MNNKQESKKIYDHPLISLIKLYACHIDISSKMKEAMNPFLGNSHSIFKPIKCWLPNVKIS